MTPDLNVGLERTFHDLGSHFAELLSVSLVPPIEHAEGSVT